MIVKPRAVSSFLARPDPAVSAVLIYGEDKGLVRERADTLLFSVVDDLGDPFRVADFSADVLKDDPARLSDEATAIAMTGGRRVVRVRTATHVHTHVFGDFLENPLGDALIVVESGALQKSSSLRKLFEGADNGAALACYADEGQGLSQLIADHLQDRHSLRIEPGALAFLAERLGSDRGVTRQELDKLALYKGAPVAEPNADNTITLADAEQAVGDGGSVQLDDIVFAATGGDLPGLDRNLTRYFSAGETPIPILRALARHLERLLVARVEMDRGTAPEQAMKMLRPPVFFKQTGAFSAQLRTWPKERLGTALQIVLDAEIDCKTTGLPANAICGRALLRIGNVAQGARSHSR